MEHMDYLTEKNDKVKKKKPKDCFRVLGLYACYILYLRIIFIGFGLAILITSLVYIVSEYKIFYLLNIISILIPIAFIILLCFNGSDRDLAIRILSIIFSKYVYEGICYFFFVMKPLFQYLL